MGENLLNSTADLIFSALCEILARSRRGMCASKMEQFPVVRASQPVLRFKDEKLSGHFGCLVGSK